MDPLELMHAMLPHFQSSFDPAMVWGSDSLGITTYVLWMVICLIITLVVVLVAGKRLTLIPTNKFVNTVEYGYQFVRKEIGEAVVGPGYKEHVPYLATLFFFILISNFVGLIPGCKTPTGSMSVVWALGIISLVYFMAQGVRARGFFGYIKSIVPSGLPKAIVPIVWCIELLSTLIRALTLTVRLYANMFAGHMALGMFALMAGCFVTGIIQGAPGAVGLGAETVLWFLFLVIMYALETLVAFIQAYVFTLLNAVYISSAIAEH